jgi:quercetin dioxygenase-like cupin family protein
MISADARLLIWPGTGAEYANMNWVRLEPGEGNRPHSHAASEDTIYIIEGRGTVENLDSGSLHEFQAGDAVYVPPGVRHAVRADRGDVVISVGGPTPPDWAMVRAAMGPSGKVPDQPSEPDAGPAAGLPR